MRGQPNNTACMVKPLTIQWSVAVVVQGYQGQQHNSCMNDDAIVCHSMRMIFAVLSSMGRDSLTRVFVLATACTVVIVQYNRETRIFRSAISA